MNRRFLLSILLLTIVFVQQDVLKPVHAEVATKTTIAAKDFTGFIGSYPISMRLNIREQTYGNVKYSGYYYYNKIGVKIQLFGSWILRPGMKSSIELNEVVNGNHTGTFYLMPTSYGNYSTLNGSWNGNGKVLKVKLTKVN